ncbi:GTP-binding protein, partial [Patulibacter sp. S7RM1-6]
APLAPDAGLVSAALREGGASVPVDVPVAGAYLLLAEHGAEELGLALHAPDGTPVEPTIARQIAPDHEHDDSVASVGIEADGELDPRRFQEWLSRLLQERGQDIFRSKGVVAIRGMEERYVFQGVHMLLTGAPGGPWTDGKRSNRLIFIGRELDRDELETGFRACLA